MGSIPNFHTSRGIIMTVYENASVYIDKDGFIKNTHGKLAQFTIDTDNQQHIDDLQLIADREQKTVYLVREFIAVDADYQDHHPRKCAKDWYLLEVKPQS